MPPIPTIQVLILRATKFVYKDENKRTRDRVRIFKSVTDAIFTLSSNAMGPKELLLSQSDCDLSDIGQSKQGRWIQQFKGDGFVHGVNFSGRIHMPRICVTAKRLSRHRRRVMFVGQRICEAAKPC